MNILVDNSMYNSRDCQTPLPCSERHQQMGFTIIELLVGMFLSTFIVGIALTYFVSSSQTFRVQTTESLIQENARFALDIITQNLRLEGLNPSNDVGLGQRIVTSFSTPLCEDMETTAAALGTTNCTIDNLGGNATASDRIAIAYLQTGDPARSAGQIIELCNGATIVLLPGVTRAFLHVFWVASDANGIRSLYCRAFDLDRNTGVGNSVPLVNGIESLQFTYGVDVDNDQVVDRYEPFSDAVANLQGIKNVRVAMLVSSGQSVVEDLNVEDTVENRRYNLAGTDIVYPGNDRQLRKIFTTTVLLPNRL